MVVFQMGEWKVKPSVSQISCPTESRTLTPQHLLGIMAFINASEHTLSKDELLKEVWQGKIVSDDAITRLISDLRKQMQIKGSAVKYIKTLHGFGYKLDIKPLLVKETATKKLNSKYLSLTATSLFVCILIVWYSLVSGDVNNKEKQQRKLTDWSVTLQTHEINLNNEANYIATGLEHSLIYHKLNDIGSAVYQQENDKSELLFQVDGKIRSLVSSPNGQLLAFIIEQPECSIQVYSLTEKTLHTLSNCRISPEYALDWQGNEHLSYVQKSNQGIFQFYQLSSDQRPIITTLNLPLCLSVRKVFINQDSQRFINCKIERGDALFIEKSGEISSLLTYRTIKDFVVANDIIYMTHSPSWKSGVTRFDYKLDKISFANIGWVWDIRLQNNKLIIVRDLKNTDLLTLNLDDLSQSTLESSKVHSSAIAIDNGVLWQLDNRGGPFALYKNQNRIAWDNEINIDLAKVVAMSISENDHWLLLTRKVDNYFVHHWLDLNIGNPSTFASYRRFESSEKTGIIENGEFFFKQRNNKIASFNISSGQVNNIELNSTAQVDNKECLGSPIETSSFKIKMFAMKQGTMFEEYQLDPLKKSRQWQDNRLLSPCGFNQIIFDRNNNRLLYTAETQKYRDISFIDLKVN